MAAGTRRHIESQMFTSENETPQNVRNAHASVTSIAVAVFQFPQLGKNIPALDHGTGSQYS